MKKILVTGGAGFIGSHLVDRLVEMGHVTVFDNLLSGKEEFIVHHFKREGFQFIKGDLRNADEIQSAMKGQDLVFHFAANPDAMFGVQNTRLDLELETIATYHVLEAMRIHKVCELVFASSGSVFGETPVVALDESYGPLLPISLYGAAKLACEGLISAYSHCFGMKSWMFRFANIIGGRATHGVIYDFLNKLKKNPKSLEILGDGTQEKPYLHVRECVDGILFGYKYAKGPVNLFLLGCHGSTSVTKIADFVVTHCGLQNVQFQYTGGDRGWIGDVPQVRFSIEKIRKLGWQPEMTSDQAVQLAIQEIYSEVFF